MNREDIRAAVLRNLKKIAPEAEPESIQPDVSFRDQLDIDSVDFLNFVVALHKELQTPIPEKDYPKLTTLNACIEYLTAATGAS